MAYIVMASFMKFRADIVMAHIVMASFMRFRAFRNARHAARYDTQGMIRTISTAITCLLEGRRHHVVGTSHHLSRRHSEEVGAWEGGVGGLFLTTPRRMPTANAEG